MTQTIYLWHTIEHTTGEGALYFFPFFLSAAGAAVSAFLFTAGAAVAAAGLAFLALGAVGRGEGRW